MGDELGWRVRKGPDHQGLLDHVKECGTTQSELLADTLLIGPFKNDPRHQTRRKII